MKRGYLIQHETDTKENMESRAAALAADKYYWDKATGKGGDTPGLDALRREMSHGDEAVAEPGVDLGFLAEEADAV